MYCHNSLAPEPVACEKGKEERRECHKGTVKVLQRHHRGAVPTHLRQNQWRAKRTWMRSTGWPFVSGTKKRANTDMMASCGGGEEAGAERRCWAYVSIRRCIFVTGCSCSGQGGRGGQLREEQERQMGAGKENRALMRCATSGRIRPC